MPETKRLFVGLELPPAVTRALADLDPHVNGLRWLDPAQIHLTLSFLGEVEKAAGEELVENLKLVHVPPFYLPLVGCGFFSSGGHPSVVWVGVGKGHPHLFALHQHVQDAVLRTGLEADLKPFHPHVTVARAKGISKEALRPLLRKYANEEFAMVHVTEFTLFSSRLSAAGAEHTAEEHFSLTAPQSADAE